MAYYTYSEGFRPGGFNRTYSPVGTVNPTGSAVAAYTCLQFVTINGVKQCQTAGSDTQYYKPAGFDSDQLTNNEIGLKSEWFSHHLLFNVSLYQMDWKNAQLSLFDPQHLGNTTFDVNGPTYRVKGFEVQFVARITDGLTLEGSTAVNSSEQTNASCLKSSVPASVSGNPTPLGQCITQVSGLPFSSPFGNVGDRAANSPPWMFNLRARYDWNVGLFHPFFWVGASHVGPQSNEPASFPDGNAPSENPPTTTYDKYEIPSVTTYDAALGVAKDNWNAQIMGSNISNEYGPSNISSGQYIKSVIPLRPRVITFQFGYKF
jgi:iron complex outermembrane recepter protein